MVRWAGLAAAVALVTLTACGTSGDGASGGGVTDAPAGEELVGRWAHYDVVAYEEPLMRTLIVSFGFNDFSIEDGQLVDAASFCFAEKVTDQPIDISLSDLATQAIRPPPTPVSVSEVDGVLRVQRPSTPTPVGLRLDHPATE